jgi:hypothetical protein
MRRKKLTFLTVLAMVLVATGIWWFTRTESNWQQKAQANTTPAKVAEAALNSTLVASPATPLSPAVAVQIDGIRTRLNASNNPAATRRILEELLELLNALPAGTAAKEVNAYLASGKDATTQLDLTVKAGGALGDASSLRVFLLDYLGQIDRPAAGALAAQILSSYTTPDEWAISLRNYAWANPGPDTQAFLQDKARQLLGNADWAKDPSAGYLEAFDAIVYAHGTALTPNLATLVRDKDNPASAHAAYLAMDRLTILEPAAMLKQLVEQPELMTGREQTRANFMARANFGDPEQRTLVEQYLLDPARDPAELDTFASLFPNANYMISNNLLTSTAIPGSGQLAAEVRAALATVEQWQNDPRFARIQPLLAKMHERLEYFDQQMQASTAGSP